MDTVKQSILDLDRDEISEWLTRQGEPPFRTGQILRWIFTDHVTDFQEMTDLSKSLRRKLERAFSLLNSRIQNRTDPVDGARKYAISLQDGQIVETVYLEKKERKTLCISSQVGCALACRFCATGTMGIIRNLTAGEILSQVILVRNDTGFREHGNIVFMGMGEPLMNTVNVLRAIQALTADWGLGWSPRRITVSTAGILPEIQRLGRADTGVNLAVSLNAPDDRTRTRIMPINRKYPIKQLMRILREFPLRSPQQKITFEYIMLRGVNDKPEHAAKLIKLLSRKRSKINLIPFNPVENSRFQASDIETIETFQRILSDAGLLVRIRHSQGASIQAACGQLAGTYDQLPDTK